MDTTSRPTAQALLRAYLEQSASNIDIFNIDPLAYAAGRELIEAAPAPVQAWAVIESVERGLADPHREAHWHLRPLRTALVRRKLSYTREQVELLIAALAGQSRLHQFDVAIASLMRIIETHVAEHGLDDLLRHKIAQLAQHLAASYGGEYRKGAERLAKLLETGGQAVSIIQWTTDEAWVETLKQALARLDEAGRGHWTALLLHCSGASASKPSQKWTKQAQAFIAAIGNAEFAALAGQVIEQIGKPAKTPPARLTGMGDQTDVTLIHDVHSDLLRGLVWATALVADDKLTHIVGAAADACFHKLAWIGPRSPKIGNACLHALSQKDDLKSIAELSRLKTRVKHASAKKQLGKSLDTVADRVGMTADELEEVAVPTCGLTGVGIMEQLLGEVSVRLEIDAAGDVGVTYQSAGKKPQAAAPAAIKETHAEEIKTLKKNVKEIDKLWPAQRNRLELLFLRQADWSLPDFRTRYLDHPLVGTLARRLIWKFGDRSGSWLEDKLVDSHDRPLEGLDENTRVRIWHPSAVPADEVAAWRGWLERHEIRQPFKQAHREIYLLTEAERQTRFYSNRFAAHIIRQHQFAALCQQRGWRYRLQGAWDSANTPTLELPRWDLCVEYLVDAIREDADVSAMQIYLHVATDQVRFVRAGSPQPVPLDEVPPLVFSEVMRDVDLFVGVCSVGNDPNWHDGGPAGRYLDYWQQYSFGNLSANAETRKAVLERVLPRMKIGPRCSFSERFLVVKGSLRTYKIHLGSGNILMEPNDQYLCLVPKRGGFQGDKVFLPFDGDELLSTILSKAVLLADDAKISEPAIVKQIKGE